jgi:hypothetical protein
VRSADPNKSEWDIRIIPATKTQHASPPAPMIDAMTPQAAKTTSKVPPMPAPPVARIPREISITPGASHLNYYDAWRAVTFSHAEYAANPSYRNEVALGLLFNQMPVTMIQKQAAPANVPEYGYITPYRYNRQSGSAMSYNFFYPKPGAYRNY